MVVPEIDRKRSERHFMNLENSRQYYGEILGGSADLRTDACCTVDAPAPEIRAALANIRSGRNAPLETPSTSCPTRAR